jgi:hypothetical protein
MRLAEAVLRWSAGRKRNLEDDALAQSYAHRQPFDDKIISQQASDSQENKWHKELEAPICRCMAGRCQSGWQIA